MRKILVVTRSMNDGLYGVAMRCLESFNEQRIEIAVRGMRSLEYFLFAMEFRDKYDWIINLDDDAFVIDTVVLSRILDYMEENDYDMCGMPDGGVDPLRGHNPFVPNAFFTVFRTGRRLRGCAFTDSLVRSARYDERWSSAANQLVVKNDCKQHPAPCRHGFLDHLKLQYQFDEFERYYPFFFYLLHHGTNVLYLLNATKHKDGTSTILRFDKKPFLYHTWYSRLYDKDETQRARIDAVIKEISQGG